MLYYVRGCNVHLTWPQGVLRDMRNLVNIKFVRRENNARGMFFKWTYSRWLAKFSLRLFIYSHIFINCRSYVERYYYKEHNESQIIHFNYQSIYEKERTNARAMRRF